MKTVDGGIHFESFVQTLGENLLLFLVGAVPLAMGFSLNDSFDLAKMSLAYTGALLLAGLYISKVLLTGGWFWKRTPLDAPLVFFLAVTFVSLIFSWDKTLSVRGQYREYAFGWAPLASFALLFWMTAQFSSPLLRSRVSLVLRWAAALISLHAALQYFGHEIFPQLPSVERGRVWSTLGNPVFMSAFLMMTLPFFLRAFIDAGNAAKGAGAVLGAAFVMAAILLASSRGAWLGSLCGAGVFLAGAVRQKKSWRRAAVIAAVLAGVSLGFFWAVSSVGSRFSNMASPLESSNRARLAGWWGAWEIVKEHPVLGTGPDTFLLAFRRHKSFAYTQAAGGNVTQAHAHNDILQWASTTGLAGLGGYVWIVVVSASFAWKQWMARRLLTEDLAMTASLLGLFVQNLFNFSSVATSLLAACLAGLWISRGYENGSEPAKTPAPFSPLRWGGGLFALSTACLAFAVLVVQPLRADAMVRRAESLSLNGKIQKAVEVYEKAIGMSPHVDEYYGMLLSAYHDWAKRQTTVEAKKALLDSAMAWAERRRAEQPRNPDTHSALGVAQMWMTQLAGEDRRQEALRNFAKALELDPTYVEAWANCARVLHFLGDSATEIKIWRYVLEMDPHHETAKKLAARLEEPAINSASMDLHP